MSQQNLGGAVYSLDIDNSKYDNKITAAEGSARGLGTTFGGVSKQVAQLGAGSVVAALAFAAPFQAAADEIRMQVATATGASGRELDALTDQVRTVATQWGVDWAAAGDVVAAVANIPTVSVKQEKALLDLTASYQRAGFNAGTMQVAVTTAMTATGAGATEAASVLAHFALQSQATGVSADTMAKAFTKSVDDFSALGFQVEESGALIAAAAAAGGTALVNKLEPALVSVQGAYEKGAIPQAEFEAKFRTLLGLIQEGSPAAAGLAEQLGINHTTMDILTQTTAGLTQEQAINITTGNGLAGSIGGATARLVTQNQETLTATERWNGFKNGVSAFIQEGLEGLPEWAKTATGAFNDAIEFGGAHATSLLLVAQNTLIMSKANLLAQKVLRIMGVVMRVVTTSALGPMLLGIVALAGIALVVASNWTTFKDIFVAVWQVVRSAVAGAVSFVVGLINRAINSINNLIRGVNSISRLVGGPRIPTLPTISGSLAGGISGGVPSSAAFSGLLGKIQAVDIGDLIGNTQASLPGFIGGGTTIEVNVAGDILESEATNNRIVAEIERAAQQGKFEGGPAGGIPGTGFE